MKQFTETQQLCMRRLKAKGTPLWDIADRLSVSVEEVKQFLKPKKTFNQNVGNRSPQK